jgi:hypothetical protein
MKNTFYLLSIIATIALGSSAFADDSSIQSKTKVTGDSDGNYEQTNSVKENDATGTTTTEEKKLKLETNPDGTVDKTKEVKKTTDPKGLMNSTTEKTTDTVKNKNGKKVYHHKKKVNGDVVEDKTTTGN